MIAKYDHNKNKKLFCKIQIKKKKKKSTEKTSIYNRIID